MFKKNTSSFFCILFFITFCFTSCRFNSLFFGPWKNDKLDRVYRWKQNNDSIHLETFGANYQPVFIKNNKDTIPKDFTIESVMFKSKKGNTLNGWFLKSKKVQPKITLLHLHGNSGNVFSQYEAMSPLLKNGFQIFMFDYSGFGYSDGTVTKENLLIDANAALDYLKTRNEINNTKLVIYGQSIGGHLAVELARQREADIDALVTEGAFTSYNSIATYYVPIIGGLLVENSYKAKNSIRKFHKPVLIIHSNQDAVVPFRMAEKLYKKANQPKELYEINGCHICGPRIYSDEISNKIKLMLSVN